MEKTRTRKNYFLGVMGGGANSAKFKFERPN